MDIPIRLVIYLIVLATIAFFVIRNRWYVPALLVLVFLGAVGATVYGIRLLNDSEQANHTAGAILIVGGLALLMGCAVGTWFFFNYRKR